MFEIKSLSTSFFQVAQNHGCAGVDGITVEVFEKGLHKNLAELEHDLKSENYYPPPMNLYSYILKKKKGW